MALTQLATGPGLRELRVVTFAERAPISVERIPDGLVSLMFLMRRDTAPSLVVLGPLTRARRKQSGGVAFTVRAVLEPQVARAVLGVPLGELTDRAVHLEHIWRGGADALRDRMAAASPVEAAAALAAEIAARRQPSTPTDALVARARGLLDAAYSIAEVARQLGVTERYLRRVFVDRTGLPPKRYARIARLQRALARMAGRRPDWARLAAELGYFDQSHFVNDFRELTDVTPEAFARVA